LRVTIPKIIAVTLAAALASYVFVIAPHLPGSLASGVAGGPSASTASPAAPARPRTTAAFPPAGKKFLGITTPTGPYKFTALRTFIRAVGHRPEVYEFSQGWAVNQFNRGVIEAVAKRGMLPMISWEPWDYRLESKVPVLRGDQPPYKLSRIIDGSYDGYIRSWAEGVKSLGFPIALRFAHEMNGFWYPWAVFANGNTMGQYVRAWRHVHTIFAQVGATNVIWVWSPNIIWSSFTDLAKMYPGNAYVSWIGLSGYYGTPGKEDYQSFNRIFNRTIAELRTFTDKPLVITETAATDVSGLMSRWITQMFHELPAHTDIIGVIWYEGYNVVDWKVTDDPAAAAAFAAGFASPQYQMRWVPGMTAQQHVPLPDT